MSDPFRYQKQRTPLLWYGLLGVTGLILVLALIPPILPVPLRAAIMDAFAPVCHQMLDRTPHFGGLPIAICDRCTGIYLGVFLGVITVSGGEVLWRRVGTYSRYLLLGSLGPLAIDWMGPILGLWGNGPSSRFVTGLVFGVIAASYVTDQLLRKTTRMKESKGFDAV